MTDADLPLQANCRPDLQFSVEGVEVQVEGVQKEG